MGARPYLNVREKFKVIKNAGDIRINEARDTLLHIIDDFLRSIRADNIVRENVRVFDNALKIRDRMIPLGDEVYLVGFGKASAEMAFPLEALLGSRLRGGVINTDHPIALQRVRVNVTSHPLPDEHTVEKSREIVEFLESLDSGSMVIFLVSGGASSLFEVPTIPLEDYRSIVLREMSRGASIEELNALRISLSSVKGGKLLKHVRAKCISLIISDVPSSPRLVGSGPTFPADGSRGKCKNIVIADNLWAREKFADIARNHGIEFSVEREDIRGDLSQGEMKMLDVCKSTGSAVFGGELTVKLGKYQGVGGRNQELALRVARKIRDEQLIFGAIGTDGKDGNSDACGAIVDGNTAMLIEAHGMPIDFYLKRHDSTSALRVSGDVIMTGPTGSNLADIYFCFKKI